ncbi:MAG: TonB family protein [Fulvivirga sp.]
MMWILLKFIACSALLMLLFQLFLAKEKAFRLNRWVLLFLIPAAMLIPFISFPINLPQESMETTSYLPLVQHQPINITQSAPSPQPVSPQYLMLVVYLAIFGLLLFKKLKALIKLIHWTKVASTKKIQGASLILSRKVNTPFSFSQYLFMHPSDYREGEEKTDMLLKHELVHIEQKHYFDLFLVELLTVVCWFNPIVYLVKKAMVINHEYLADQEVQETYQPIKYKKLLLQFTAQNKPTIGTSSISNSDLKNRLVMMNKPIKKTKIQFRIISFSLLATLIITGFSVEVNAQQTPSTSQKTNKGGWDQYVEIETQPEFKGGMEAFYQYVENQLEYPIEARQKGTEGIVEIQFVVEKDGSLSNVTAIKGIGFGCDAEAVSVVQNAPAFNPGKQRGRPVRVQMVLPVLFSLNKSDPDNLPSGAFSVKEVDQRNGQLDVDATYANGLWTGTVRDPEGNPLPGATIITEDPYVGTVTDINGQFSIKIAQFERLTIIFVGYKSVKLVGK